jgi:Domain of unknown function (DUF1707)
MSDPATLRVADADRERLGDELREHLVAGRLSQEEFEERLERALEARTQGELDSLRGDLPMSADGVRRAQAERRRHLRRRLVQEAGGTVGVSAVCVAVWLASGASGQFWPIWVILFGLIAIARDAWRLFGPAPDVDALEGDLQARRARRDSRAERRAERRGLGR